jgi:hypothetical protein
MKQLQTESSGGYTTTSRSKAHENAGESFMRYVTNTTQRSSSETDDKNPFIETRWNRGFKDTTANGDDSEFTKFHLADDEMLLELLSHLHADCPDLMHDKQILLDRVAILFDKIQPQT